MSAALAARIGPELANELREALGRIVHCLSQISDEELWWRPRPEMNSIGNLLLHLAGNVRQYLISGLGGEPDIRNRPAEFAERGPLPRAEVMQRLESTVAEACRVLESLPADEWLRVRRIQGWDRTGLYAGVHSVSHFRGHVQEIIHQTRMLRGPAYQFAFVPQTKEQGAAS